MTHLVQLSISIFHGSLRWTGFALSVICALAMIAVQPSQAQTFTVLHNFSGGSAGASPNAGLTVDAAGSLYGTTYSGGRTGGEYCGQGGCGTVFKLTSANGGWVLKTLYSFQGGSDGASPAARVVFGPDGALYGTTQSGQPGSGGNCPGGFCGTVFRLTPPATVCRSVSCPWTETVLYGFTGDNDGGVPGFGDLIFDPAGNIYGTTEIGGPNSLGTVYELTHGSGGWRESVLYSFSGLDGDAPIGGLIFDNAGNLWGTTVYGGNGYQRQLGYDGWGVIFQLTLSDSGWTESTVYKFHDYTDGALPYGALTVDSAGNLYGTASAGGSSFCWRESEDYGGCGTVFQFLGGDLDPLYSFPGNEEIYSPPGPQAPLTIDSASNLYGTSNADGANYFGNIFKLAAQSNGNWTYVSLYDFTGGNDGKWPISNVAIDHNGNLYGTTQSGGSGGDGVIWEITP